MTTTMSITAYNAHGESLYVEQPDGFDDTTAYRIDTHYDAICFMAHFKSGLRYDENTGRYVRNRIISFMISYVTPSVRPTGPRFLVQNENCERTPAAQRRWQQTAAGARPVYRKS